MPHPKHRHSKTRRDKRRTHDKLKAVPLAKCSNCGALTPSHRVCAACGYYKGRPVIVKKEKKKKQKKA